MRITSRRHSAGRDGVFFELPGCKPIVLISNGGLTRSIRSRYVRSWPEAADPACLLHVPLIRGKADSICSDRALRVVTLAV